MHKTKSVAHLKNKNKYINTKNNDEFDLIKKINAKIYRLKKY